MDEPIERRHTRQIEIQYVERQCLAPGCDEWFVPVSDVHRTCSHPCRQALYVKRKREREDALHREQPDTY